MKRIVIASLLLGLAACSDNNDGATGAGGAGATGGTGGSAGSTAGSGGSGGGTDAGGSIPTGTCTEGGSVCATFKLPAVTETPTRLIVGFYLMDLPPLGPPDKTGALFEKPEITPGTEMQMKMAGVAVDGEYYLYAALYMPGGGQFQTKKGIDYEAFTTTKLTLSKGAPVTVPGTLEFSLAK